MATNLSDKDDADWEYYYDQLQQLQQRQQPEMMSTGAALRLCRSERRVLRSEYSDVTLNKNQREERRLASAFRHLNLARRVVSSELSQQRRAVERSLERTRRVSSCPAVNVLQRWRRSGSTVVSQQHQTPEDRVIRVVESQFSGSPPQPTGKLLRRRQLKQTTLIGPQPLAIVPVPAHGLRHSSTIEPDARVRKLSETSYRLATSDRRREAAIQRSGKSLSLSTLDIRNDLPVAVTSTPRKCTSNIGLLRGDEDPFESASPSEVNVDDYKILIAGTPTSGSATGLNRGSSFEPSAESRVKLNAKSHTPKVDCTGSVASSARANRYSNIW